MSSPTLDTGSLLKLSISSKKQFYTKLEAEELMDKEQQRRVDESSTRYCEAKKMITEKEHQIIIDEIKECIKIGDMDRQIENVETEFRNFIIGHQGKEEEKCESLETSENQYLITGDSQKKLLTLYDHVDDEIEEEASQLSEKPYPKPEKYNGYNIKIYAADSQDQKHIQVENKKKEDKKSKKNFIFKSPESIRKQNIKQAIQSPQPTRVFYRNNFDKNSKFINKVLKDSRQTIVKSNLKNELNELVQTYSQSEDPDKVEDMILELNRVSQKSNGIIPQQQQQKLSQYASQLEMNKLTYSRVQQSKSPNPRCPLQSTTPLTELLQKGIGSSINKVNVNSGILKNIIMNTESKVKQNLRGFYSGATTNQSSARHSFDNKQKMQTPEQQNEKKASIKEQVRKVLERINSRKLARFFQRKMKYLMIGDYEVGYLLALLVAIVDENIHLNNEKNDLNHKSWEDLSRQLSNHGNIIFSLSKLKIMIEKDEFQRQIQKLQFVKKYEEMKQQFDENNEISYPLIAFLDGIYTILHQVKQGKEDYQDKKQCLATQNSFHKKQYSSTNKKSSNYESPLAQRHFLTTQTSPSQISIQGKSPRPQTIQSQLIQQKRLTHEKNYKFQLEQSKNIHEKELQAYAKKLEIQRLKFLNSALQASINKEDRLKHEEERKKEEQEYLQYQSEHRRRLNSKDNRKIEQERQMLRETSLENQEYLRSARLSQREKDSKFHKEEYKKSLEESKWREQLNREKLMKKIEQLRVKQQEKLMEKVNEVQDFVNSKDTELDERLKSQVEKVRQKFRELEKQEESVKEEMNTLQKIQGYKKKQK